MTVAGAPEQVAARGADTGVVSRTGLPRPRRTLAIAAVLGAMSMVVLDAGMANVALPTLAQAMGASPADAVLVVTAYQTALVMALLPCAAVGERFGNRRVFRGGVGLFVVASILCAASPSLPWLIGMRFLQGLGGAAVMALGVALVRASVSPRELGAAIGWNALTVALSSAVCIDTPLRLRALTMNTPSSRSSAITVCEPSASDRSAAIQTGNWGNSRSWARLIE